MSAIGDNGRDCSLLGAGEVLSEMAGIVWVSTLCSFKLSRILMASSISGEDKVSATACSVRSVLPEVVGGAGRERRLGGLLVASLAGSKVVTASWVVLSKERLLGLRGRQPEPV